MLWSYTFILLISSIAVILAEVRFTNIQCTAFDPPFADFDQCDLKLLRRGIVGLNVLVRLHQVPITNISVNLSMHKKANGYRPFLYNVTFDMCDFFKRRAKYPILKLAIDAFEKDSNINHTCPYDHDVIVHNWVLQTEAFRLFPVPSGEYAIVAKVGAYNKWKAEVKIYFYRKE